MYFSARNAVSPQSGRTDDLQQAWVGIGLDGIVNMVLGQVGCAALNGLERRMQQLQVVIIERSVQFLNLC